MIIQEVTRILVIGSGEGFVRILDHKGSLIWSCTPSEGVVVEDPISWRFPKYHALSKFRILCCKIESVAHWGLWISTLILSISLSVVLLSSLH